MHRTVSRSARLLSGNCFRIWSTSCSASFTLGPSMAATATCSFTSHTARWWRPRRARWTSAARGGTHQRQGVGVMAPAVASRRPLAQNGLDAPLVVLRRLSLEKRQHGIVSAGHLLPACCPFTAITSCTNKACAAAIIAATCVGGQGGSGQGAHALQMTATRRASRGVARPTAPPPPSP